MRKLVAQIALLAALSGCSANQRPPINPPSAAESTEHAGSAPRSAAAPGRWLVWGGRTGQDSGHQYRLTWVDRGELSTAAELPSSNFVWSPDGRWLAYCALRDEAVTVLEIAPRRVVRSVELSGPCGRLSWSPKSQRFVVMPHAAPWRVVDVGRQLTEKRLPDDDLWLLDQWSADGRFFTAKPRSAAFPRPSALVVVDTEQPRTMGFGRGEGTGLNCRWAPQAADVTCVEDKPHGWAISRFEVSDSIALKGTIALQNGVTDHRWIKDLGVVYRMTGRLWWWQTDAPSARELASGAGAFSVSSSTGTALQTKGPQATWWDFTKTPPWRGHVTLGGKLLNGGLSPDGRSGLLGKANRFGGPSGLWLVSASTGKARVSELLPALESTAVFAFWTPAGTWIETLLQPAAPQFLLQATGNKAPDLGTSKRVIGIHVATGVRRELPGQSRWAPDDSKFVHFRWDLRTFDVYDVIGTEVLGPRRLGELPQTAHQIYWQPGARSNGSGG